MNELANVLAAHEPLASRYANFLASIEPDAALPAATLNLCRLRIAYIHACQAEIDVGEELVPEAIHSALQRADFSEFSVRDVCALVLAEQVPWQHHAVSDGEVAAAQQHFGAAGTVSLLTACAFFDVNCRLQSVLRPI